MPSGVCCRIDHAGAQPPDSFQLTGFRGALVAQETKQVAGVLAGAEAAAGRGLWVAGFVSYEAAPAFDPALTVSTVPPRVGLPLAWFGLFDSAVESRGEALVDRGRPDGADWQWDMGPDDHAAAVESVRTAVAEGKVYLVNLTARLRAPAPPDLDPLELYGRVCGAHAGGFHALIETDDWAVACGSPELFLEMADGSVTTRPMKGTARRGRWAEEDARAATGLATSDKERAENVMVVDLLRNDLGRVAEAGGVEVPRIWDVERYPTAWQLTSTVTARLRPGTGLTEVFAAAFPSGSVTGAPKVTAMQSVAHLETSPRGVYCGAVGFIRPTGRGRSTVARFAVAIRTAVVDKNREVVEYGSGGGITWDSEAAEEWQELCHKAEAVRSGPPAPPLGLIETMGYAPASGSGPGQVRNLDDHLERLARSADYLGIPAPHAARQVIESAVRPLLGPSRVRLHLHPDGRLAVTVAPMRAEPTEQMLTLCVDAVPVDPSDITLFHKVDRRGRYDRVAGRHPHADDVIMVNGRGEVTETTRANLLVRLGGRWYTPPVCCGLLPGVGRSRLLAAGSVAEKVMTVADLAGAERLATVSSLRGWRAARLLPGCPVAGTRAGG